jgi:hypothetical protein
MACALLLKRHVCAAKYLATQGGEMKTPSELLSKSGENGAIGYILLWVMGVPASLLFVIFLLRGCN